MRKILCAVAAVVALNSTGCGLFERKPEMSAEEAHGKYVQAIKELVKLRLEAHDLMAAAKAALDTGDEAKFQDVMPNLRANLEKQAEWLRQAKDATVNDDVRKKAKDELKRVEADVAAFAELEQSYRRDAQGRSWALSETTIMIVPVSAAPKTEQAPAPPTAPAAGKKS